MTGQHTKTFMSFYIILSVVLLGFVVNNLQQLKAERKQLTKVHAMLVKKSQLEFLRDINDGKGVDLIVITCIMCV